jgi:hypothetical protein
VWGQTKEGYGVAGTADSGNAIQGGSISGFGVVGTSGTSIGVIGISETGTGLHARGGTFAADLQGHVSIGAVTLLQHPRVIAYFLASGLRGHERPEPQPDVAPANITPGWLARIDSDGRLYTGSLGIVELGYIVDPIENYVGVVAIPEAGDPPLGMEGRVPILVFGPGTATCTAAQGKEIKVGSSLYPDGIGLSNRAQANVARAGIALEVLAQGTKSIRVLIGV